MQGYCRLPKVCVKPGTFGLPGPLWEVDGSWGAGVVLDDVADVMLMYKG